MHAAKQGRPPAPSRQIRLKEPVYNQWQSLLKNKSSDSEFAKYLLKLLQTESDDHKLLTSAPRKRRSPIFFIVRKACGTLGLVRLLIVHQIMLFLLNGDRKTFSSVTAHLKKWQPNPLTFKGGHSLPKLNRPFP